MSGLLELLDLEFKTATIKMLRALMDKGGSVPDQIVNITEGRKF